MANTKAAKKYIRTSARKRKLNDFYRRRYRRLVKKIMDLLKEKKNKEALKLYPEAQKAIDKAVKRGVIKKNTGARKKSSLMKKIQA